VHSLDPDLLLGAADELVGCVPGAELLTIVGASFEVGESLSPAVSQRLPEMLQKARAIVEFRRHHATRELAY
jgi:Ni,Fe-hydrogenase maturation factor